MHFSWIANRMGWLSHRQSKSNSYRHVGQHLIKLNIFLLQDRATHPWACYREKWIIHPHEDVHYSHSSFPYKRSKLDTCQMAISGSQESPNCGIPQVASGNKGDFVIQEIYYNHPIIYSQFFPFDILVIRSPPLKTQVSVFSLPTAECDCRKICDLCLASL